MFSVRLEHIDSGLHSRISTSFPMKPHINHGLPHVTQRHKTNVQQHYFNRQTLFISSCTLAYGVRVVTLAECRTCSGISAISKKLELSDKKKNPNFVFEDVNKNFFITSTSKPVFGCF
jgi:hypothetical protein